MYFCSVVSGAVEEDSFLFDTRTLRCAESVLSSSTSHSSTLYTVLPEEGGGAGGESTLSRSFVFASHVTSRSFLIGCSVSRDTLTRCHRDCVRPHHHDTVPT